MAQWKKRQLLKGWGVCPARSTLLQTGDNKQKITIRTDQATLQGQSRMREAKAGTVEFETSH